MNCYCSYFCTYNNLRLKNAVLGSHLTYLYRVTVSSYLSVREAGPDGAVATSSANGVVGTGFASRYRLNPDRVFIGLMGSRVTTNY